MDIKNILITGASGFVGQEVVKRFSKNKKFNLFLVTRKKIKKTDNIKKIYKVKNLFSITEKRWLYLLNDIDIVLHLAWFAKPPNYLNSKKNFQSLYGTINLAKASKKKNIKRFLSAGTCFEYLFQNKKISVNSALDPNSIYAASKLSCYFMLREIFKNSKIEFSWLRFFYIQGKNDYKEKLIPSIMYKLEKNQEVFLKTPYNVIDFLRVEKLSVYIEKIVNKKKLKQVYNLCSGKGKSIKDIAFNLAKKNKKKFISFKKGKKNIVKVIGIPNF